MFGGINKKEWQFLGIFWIVIAIIVFLPIIIGYLVTPPGSHFLFDSSYASADHQAYLSKIEQAKRGSYLFKDFFTSETQPLGVLNPFWLAIGIFAKVFNLSGLIAFHVVNFLLLPVFLIVSYRTVSFFFEEESRRKVCCILLLIASGIGVWVNTFLLGASLQFPSMATPEAFFLTALFFSPHFTASLILLMLVLLLSFRAFENYQLRYSLLAGLCVLLLISFHPYSVYTIFFMILAFIVAESVFEKKIYLSHIGHYAILLVFAAPPLLYDIWVLINVPAYYETLFLQNITLTQNILVVLVDYGPLLLLAVIGAIPVLRQRPVKKRDMFLIVWVLTGFFLLYLPVNTQRRLFEGLNIPIIILATSGLFFLKDWQGKGLFGRTITSIKKAWLSPLQKPFLVFLMMVIFSMPHLVRVTSEFLFYNNYYITSDNYKAMEWIDGNTPKESIILSSLKNGNIMPVIAYRQVYLGHWGETIRFMEKKELAGRFFWNYSSEERRHFLQTNNIGYIFWGPEERVLTDNFNPDQEDFLQKVYGNGSVAVYRVN